MNDAVIVRAELIAADRATAAAMLNLAVSTFSAYVSRGLLPQPRQIGGNARWLVEDLRTAAHALPVSEILPPPRGGE